MRISDWSSDVCSSDLIGFEQRNTHFAHCSPDFGFVQRATAPQLVEDTTKAFAKRIEHCHSLCGVKPRFPSYPAQPAHRNANTPADETSPTSVYRSEEHTSELQSLMRISYAVFCLKKKNKQNR